MIEQLSIECDDEKCDKIVSVEGFCVSHYIKRNKPTILSMKSEKISLADLPFDRDSWTISAKESELRIARRYRT